VIVAIPISYNLRSAVARWPSALVSVLGIAGTVGVFVAMLAMARGFQATLISSGSSQNAMILRAGADSEMVSAITLEEVRTIGDAPEVARGAGGAPLVSP
jgi:putative ABC transport system permease protein